MCLTHPSGACIDMLSMASDVKLVRNSDGSLRFDYGTPPASTVAAKQPPSKGPTQQSPKLVIDDSVAFGNSASASLWGDVARSLEGLFDSVPAAAPSSPAEAFHMRARNEPWFVNAEMVTPKGGRKVGGRTAVRAPQLEVTVRNGGAQAAEHVMSELGLTGRVVEQRPIPGAYRHGRR